MYVVLKEMVMLLYKCSSLLGKDVANKISILLNEDK